MTISKSVQAANTAIEAIRLRQEEYRVRAVASMNAYNERYKKAAAIDNDGLAPTIDRDNRYHAPCDGYLYEDAHGEMVKFMAGQYLPIPRWEDEMGFFMGGGNRGPFDYKLRIKMAVEVIEVLRAMPDRVFGITNGKAWDENGVQVSYAYLTLPTETFRDDLQKILGSVEFTKELRQNENLTPVVEGRIVIKGEIISTKFVDSRFGTTEKMLVLDERDFKVWGTIPSSIYEAKKGDKVEFTATVERSEKDPSFGFFKRPAKAVLTQAESA